jgi:hypothetical protein
MAIKSITESWEGRKSWETADEITALRIFTVEFDEKDDPLARPLLALNATTPELSIPQYGNQHPYNRDLFVIGKDVKAKEGAFVYEVTCNYSTLYIETEKQKNPLNQKPEISWTFATSNEPIDMAIAMIEPKQVPNVPILNSALEPFDPPITEDQHDLVLRYVRNERTFYPMTALQYKGSVNADMFLGAPPGTVMCTVFDGDKIYDDRWGNYYRITYEFQFRLKEVNGKKYGWLRRILDQGYRELTYAAVGDEPEWENIVDKNGNQVSQPVPLDGTGLEQKYKGVYPPPGIYLVFQTREKIPFSPLNIKV